VLSNAEVWFLVDDFYVAVYERLGKGERRFENAGNWALALAYIRSRKIAQDNLIERFGGSGYTVHFEESGGTFALVCTNKSM